jgi:hypothetical protein
MLDLFFDKQPPRAFERDLRQYEIPNIKKHDCDAESVSVDGLNLDFGQFAKEKVLSTSFDRLSRVLKANSLLGGGYNLKVKKDEKLKSEEFIFDARKDCCVISAGTVDGVRRGLIYFEDLLVVGGGNLKLGRIFIKPKIELRLARCFFAPINRPPKNLAELDDEIDYYPEPVRTEAGGCIIPFGDGPKPIFERRVGKSVIQNMLSAANDYVYMTSPYLIIDNELCTAIEGAALRGVDVRIIIPHIPDKKLVFEMSRSYYNRLMAAGVKIYEYKPGFIHAKSYVADGKYAMIGTINLDYRSLVHHFENGVWMYRCDSIADIKRDIDGVIAESIEVSPDMLRAGLLRRFIRAAVRIFSPML